MALCAAARISGTCCGRLTIGGMETTLLLWGRPELQAGATSTVFVPERRFQLLAWLALQPARSCSRDEAAALLWPGHDPASGRRNLRKVLVEARAVPGTNALQVDEHRLHWPVRTDIDGFEAALQQTAAPDDEAVAWRRGPLLSGLEVPAQAAWSDWLAAERRHLDSRWQRAAHLRLAAPGDAAARERLAEQLLALDPLDDLAMAAWLACRIAAGETVAVRQAWQAYEARLAQELGIEAPSALSALVERAGASALRPAPPAAAASAASPDANRSLAAAPARHPSFVGRRAELAALGAQLARPGPWLLTICGPGGVGKSRLVAELLAQATTPVLAVEMQDLDDSRALAARLARRLDITLDDWRDSAVQIAAAWPTSALGDPASPPLLSLDNAEHIADLADWLGRLREAAPTLRLLVTSRSRLRLPDEQVLPLQGLALPDEDSHDIEAAPAFDAVRLFAERATRALPGFSLEAALPAVIDIVQRCAGLPLAIELAAAWVRLLPAEVVARELRESIDLLERDPAQRTLPARPEHSSLRAVFERSLALLSPAERDALEALALFRGGFLRASAQAVTGTALPLLASLVDKSLLGTADDGRFVLHPLVAAIALERLQADPTRHARLQLQHASHHLRRLAEAGGRRGDDTRAIDTLIDAEEADLRQAWQHALALHLGELVAPTLTVWAGFFERRGRLKEGSAQLQPALQWPQHDAAADRVLGRARAAVARLWFIESEPRERVHALAASGLAPARAAGDAVALGVCLATRAACDSELGRFDAARAGFEEALALAEAQGQAASAVRCLRNLGSVATRAGDYDAALASMRLAQQRAREAGLAFAEADALMAQAGPHLERADWAAAEQVLREALAMASALDARQLQLNGRCMLGCALIELGRLDEAGVELRRVREQSQALAQTAGVVYADTYLALAAARAGRLDEAEPALLAIERQSREAGRHLGAMRALLFRGEVLARRGDTAGAAAAWQAVADDAALPAGERDTARRWAAALPGAPGRH